MPLPLILGMGAATAAAVGAKSGVQGAVKMKKASDTQKKAQRRHQRNLKRFEQETETTNQEMDDLGKLELSILKNFETFSDLMEKIQNRPEFRNLAHEEFQIPEYNPEELKKTSVGAGVLLGGLGGAALGTAGGFAAAGATTAAVMALGTASTGTAIASLSGAAAVNATLAALGGGALAAGGGGMALGSAVLGAATLGVGILVGGIIFNLVGNSISDKADEAWKQMKDEVSRTFLIPASTSSFIFRYWPLRSTIHIPVPISICLTGVMPRLLWNPLKVNILHHPIRKGVWPAAGKPAGGSPRQALQVRHSLFPPQS